MDPSVLGSKLASSLMASLVRKLFRPNAPGAGLVDKPVRLSALVSFRGEKRVLGEREVRALARRIVDSAIDSPGEPPFPADEHPAVVEAMTARLLALGDLDMDDIQAVRLGHRELARKLRAQAPAATTLSRDADYFLDSATEWACLQILEFFTRRSTFVARTLVEQSRYQAELIAKIDELLSRTPRPGAEYRLFEQRYLRHIADRHNHITIYGIDLRDSPDRWPLEVAYLSLEATTTEDRTLPEEHPSGPVTVQLPAEEALLAHDRVLLRGDAGSGKTTLVQWLAVTAAREGVRIPYVLPLRTLIRAGALPPVESFLSAVSCPLTPPAGWTEHVLTAGRGLILVDGLDEIPAPDRTHTRDWLLALIHAFPGNRWLLTSRPTAVRPDWLSPEGFHELLLAPMRRSEVATFVHRWHTAAEAPEHEGPLLDSLRTKRDLARLATNPLMCGLICALHRERRGYLPTGRKELYDAALTMLLTRRDLERGMSSTAELGEEAQLEVLQRLAYALVLSGRTEMDTETAEGIVERCLPSIAVAGDAPGVLRSLLLRSGLLRQPAHGVVDFVHRTFQDYLGARYAVEEGHLDVLLSHADDTQWEDVIRLAVAHARPRERASLLRQLLSKDTPRLTLLALACLEHATALDPAVRSAVESRTTGLIPPRTTEDAKVLAEAGPLVLELLPGPEGLTDEEALGVTVTASRLGGEEPEGALAILRRFREHPDIKVRRQLVGTWARFHTDEYAKEVLDRLDRRNLFITCESAEQRKALARMRPWFDVVFQGAHAVEDILACLHAPEAMTFLSFWDNPLLTDLSALLPFSSLTRMAVHDCPTLVGVDLLSTLDHLNFSFIEDLTGLRSLRSVRSLSVNQELPGAHLGDALPLDAPLGSLLLGRNSTDTTGLRGLQHWSGLRTLSLGLLSTELSVTDWNAVTELPELEHLSLNAAIIRDFPHSIEAMPELPGIGSLQVLNLHGAEDLSPLVPRLPNLRSVSLHGRPDEPLSATLYAGLFPNVEINVEAR
ncbi:NACHT domain-containing protein [Streptomyces sp. S3(2020)]|uniref:NACHT domain-containing protein n=1 Tax=Streptomyces sp. S3(2020) TaxID=2732044 RepID=UPI001487AC35|nr:NACHT domain-containing protein [Streptomyces sp. S3(2020)]NNN37324.1 NACHT domain-containing protein [Streptomyces sp. S3(2020)]